MSGSFLTERMKIFVYLSGANSTSVRFPGGRALGPPQNLCTRSVAPPTPRWALRRDLLTRTSPHQVAAAAASRWALSSHPRSSRLHLCQNQRPVWLASAAQAADWPMLAGAAPSDAERGLRRASWPRSERELSSASPRPEPACFSTQARRAARLLGGWLPAARVQPRLDLRHDPGPHPHGVLRLPPLLRE